MTAFLDTVRLWMTRYAMSTMLAFGLIGNVINIFMFTRKEPLRNSCIMYLVAAFTLNLLITSWGIIPTLYNLDNVNPATYSYMFCKLRHYIVHTVLMIGRSLTVLACIDRFALCTNSVRIHFFNEPKIAIRLIIGVFLIWPLLNIHLTLSYNFTGSACVMIQSYTVFWAIYSIIVPGLLMPVLMGLFGILAITHRRQLQAKLNGSRRASRKRDYALIIMLFSEVMVYIVSTSLFPAVTLYQVITNNQVKSIERQQTEAFVNFLATSFLIYLNPSAGFYVYIVASQNYRMECKRALVRIYMRMTGRRAQVGPSTMVREATIQHRTIHC